MSLNLGLHGDISSYSRSIFRDAIFFIQIVCPVK